MKVYFAGLGGTALAPLAQLVLDAGHQVFGSDPHYGPAIAALEQRGVLYSNDQSGAFLRQVHQAEGIDWLVQTSALPADHPELTTARELGLKISKRDQFIADLVRQYDWQMIAVAGTHGKTTTTTMLIWLWQQLGLEVNYLVGSSLPFGPAGHFTPNSRYFIYECDEYDHNFLAYHPDFSLIPSISHDHVDIFPTKQDYELAFKQFISQSKQVWLWQHDYRPAFEGLAQINLVDQIDPRLILLGKHNRANATLALTLAQNLQLADQSQLIDILNRTPSAGRRFEILKPGLVTDYAHHPEEIAATLELAGEYRDQQRFKQIVVVYQPHQNSRQHQFKDDYAQAFNQADQIYWLPTYLVREDPKLATLTADQLTAKLSQAQTADTNPDLIQQVKRHLKQGDLVIAMSAGPLDEWLRANLSAMAG